MINYFSFNDNNKIIIFIPFNWKKKKIDYIGPLTHDKIDDDNDKNDDDNDKLMMIIICP